MSMHGPIVIILLYAGTGKTTTLVEFTKTHPSLTFLYTVYNRSMKESADMIFCSSNVECRTFHSIAYQAIRYVSDGEVKLYTLR